MNKKWIRFELNSEMAPTEQFEIWFCRKFFAIQQWIKLDDVQIIDWLKWIENIPVNGVAFQSKFTKNWSWPQIKKSLKEILKAKRNEEKPFDKLSKVYVYVKKISSSKYLNDSIIDELKKIWVEVEIYAKWEKIWKEDKYEDLREYFKEKVDIDYEIKLVEKYLDNLYLDISEDLLKWIFEKFDNLTHKQKANYYIYLARLKEFKNLFQNHNNYDKTFYQDLMNSYKYFKSDKTKLNKAIWLYFLWNKEEAKEIIEKLIKQEWFNEFVYWFYLIIKSDNYGNFDDLLNIVKKEYKNNQYVKWILWNISKNMWLEHIYAFEKFYKQDYSKINKFNEKITYFRIWSKYLNEKYWLYNLSLEAKKEYLKLKDFITSFENNVEWKGLIVEIELLNTNALINSQIKWNIEKADYYFNKSLDKQNSWIIKVNKLLNLINSKEIKHRQEAKKILEEIYNNFERYLDLEKNNPNRNILFQIHWLLAQEYFKEYNELKNKWQIPSEKLKTKWLKILKEFKEKYYNEVSDFDKRNFWLLDIQSEPEEAWDKVVDYLKEDNCIIYNLLAYNFLKDEKYINNAYKLYKSWKKENFEKNFFESVFQLADTFLYKLKDKEKFFEIIDNELNDLSNIKYFKDYIIRWINIWKSKKVLEKLEQYKKENWIDYHYIMLKSYFKERKWDKKEALEIINNFDDLNNYIDLLQNKSYLEHHLWKYKEYKKTLQDIYEIWLKTNFSNFKIEDILNFISSYWLVDLEKTIELCYNFLQKNNILDKEKLELKKKYFSLMIQNEQKWMKFLDEEITEDSVVTITDENQDKKIICLDWISSKEYYFDKIVNKKDEVYKKLIWKKVWDEIINLFWDKFWIEQKYKIVEIKNKYIYFYQLCFSKYSDELWILKINLAKKDWEYDFSNFLNILDNQWKKENNRKKYINENFTKKWLLTFKILKDYYWKSYIDQYYQKDFELLKSDQLFKPEKWKKIQNIMLDPSSIISIFEFWIEDILKNNFNLYISQSTFESFNNDLVKLNNEPKSKMSVHSDWEWNHYKNEIPKDFYKNRQEYLEKIINFLKNNCKIESSDLLLLKKDWLDDVIWKEFYDSLLISKDKWYYLFSDEQVLRRLSRTEKVKTFWIKSLLIHLSSQKLINSDFLLDSYIKLIDLNFNWLLIHSWLIYYLLIKNNIINLEKVILYIKNKYNDINFIVWSLIYIELQIKNFRWTVWDIWFKFKDWAKKYYFDILYKIILKYFDKKEVDKLLYKLINK